MYGSKLPLCKPACRTCIRPRAVSEVAAAIRRTTAEDDIPRVGNRPPVEWAPSHCKHNELTIRALGQHCQVGNSHGGMRGQNHEPVKYIRPFAYCVRMLVAPDIIPTPASNRVCRKILEQRICGTYTNGNTSLTNSSAPLRGKGGRAKASVA